MREPVKDKGRLQHILQAIENVEQYTAGINKECLRQDKLRTHATAYNIQIVGEACYKLTKEFKDNHPATPRYLNTLRLLLIKNPSLEEFVIFISIAQLHSFVQLGCFFLHYR